MRMNYILDKSMGSISFTHLGEAARLFYEKFKTAPDVIKLKYEDYDGFIRNSYQLQINILDKSKKYGIFITVPGGMAELCVLDEDVSNAATNSNTVITLESNFIDKEFEKHVLSESK